MEKALEIQRKVIEILGTDEVYLVGGSVRDIVMGQEAKDYDFTTPMLPDDVERAVEAAGRHAYAIGKRFGTIGFKVPVYREKYTNPFEYVEVTTFRSEVYTSKSRKPEVAFVPSLEEDLARRDFTFNSMVLKPDGSIYDPYGGRIDILKRLIKTVGLPKDRIIEDPLRMLRAARFAARYEFDIDPNFIGKSRQLADRIYDVSIERWVQELDKTFTSASPYLGLHNLHEMGLAARILPELYGNSSYCNPFECEGDKKDYENADLAWKFLLSNIIVPDRVKNQIPAQKYINSGICQRLKFSNERTNIILNKKP